MIGMTVGAAYPVDVDQFARRYRRNHHAGMGKYEALVFICEKIGQVGVDQECCSATVKLESGLSEPVK